MDPKGRVVLPARLKARLPDATEQKIVIVLGFEKCLTIYTMSEWEQKLRSFAEISEYDDAGQQFIRDFTYGMAEESLDGQGRFSLNKFLIEYAGLDSDVILAGVASRIEIWNAAEYKKNLSPMESRKDLRSVANGIFNKNQNPTSQNQ
jgi:MraZ protein